MFLFFSHGCVDVFVFLFAFCCFDGSALITIVCVVIDMFFVFG